MSPSALSVFPVAGTLAPEISVRSAAGLGAVAVFCGDGIGIVGRIEVENEVFGDSSAVVPGS